MMKLPGDRSLTKNPIVSIVHIETSRLFLLTKSMN